MSKKYVLPITPPIARCEGYYWAIELNVIITMIEAALLSYDEDTECDLLTMVYDTVQESPKIPTLEQRDQVYNHIVDLYNAMLASYLGYMDFFMRLSNEDLFIKGMEINLKRQVCIVEVGRIPQL